MLNILLLDLQKPLLKDLRNIVVPKVASKWYEVGVQLFNQSQLPRLNEIQATYLNDHQGGCAEMFRFWLEITPGASWNSLIHAITAPGLELLSTADNIHKKLKG